MQSESSGVKLTRFEIEGWLELIGTPSGDILHRSDCAWLLCLLSQYLSYKFSDIFSMVFSIVFQAGTGKKLRKKHHGNFFGGNLMLNILLQSRKFGTL